MYCKIKDMKLGLWLTWAWVGVGFDNSGSWVLTTVVIGLGFDEIGVGVTTVEIGVVQIDGWWDCRGGDRWIGFLFFYEFWVLILLWILSFDFAIDFGWMARLGFDFAQREWHRWWIGILLGLWRVWVYGGGCLEVVWLRGWLLCGESDKETEIRKERDIICLLFWLHNLYYFNVLYCKIKVGMLGVL